MDVKDFFRGRYIEVDREVLRQFGFERSREEVMVAVEKARVAKKSLKLRGPVCFFRVLCENLGIEISNRVALEMDNLFIEKFSRSVELLDSVRFTLAELRRRGFRMAIISNSNKKFVRKVLRFFKIEEYFELVVGCDTTGLKKGELEPFRYALEKLGLKPCEVVMVGDDEYQDILPAKKLGIKTVKIIGEEGSMPKKLKEESCADFAIKKLSALLGILL
ncbi:MAG: HAD-IA family hydrolase [Candidatus Freyarchaeota archaeon]|nr:HAD-IA family hydrolase [Candidatus Jordarchaeia archaeon]